MQSERQSGRTTYQIQNAPQGAHYVWCNSQTGYPKDLARHLGRLDLKIVGQDFLKQDRWRGRKIVELVVDHASPVTAEMLRAIELIERMLYDRS